MRNQIIFADGTAFDIPVQPENPVQPLKRDRLYKCISVVGEAAAVKAAFTDNAVYRREWESITGVDENGENIIGVETEDLSAYSLAFDVVDKRNGNCIAIMGKPTETELLQAQLAAAETAMVEGVNSINE